MIMADSSLITFDKQLIQGIVFRVFLDGKKINFQFAPKIVSDANTSAWDEHDIWSIELLRIHKGSVGRRIVMEWEYVATDSKFTGSYIATELRKLKTYFFAFDENTYPVIEMKYTHIVPVITYFRLRDLNIQHSPELVKQGDTSYPLHTKVSCTLELATSARGPTSAKGKKSHKEQDKVDVPPINQAVKPEWY